MRRFQERLNIFLANYASDISWVEEWFTRRSRLLPLFLSIAKLFFISLFWYFMAYHNFTKLFLFSYFCNLFFRKSYYGLSWPICFFEFEACNMYLFSSGKYIRCQLVSSFQLLFFFRHKIMRRARYCWARKFWKRDASACFQIREVNRPCLALETMGDGLKPRQLCLQPRSFWT